MRKPICKHKNQGPDGYLPAHSWAEKQLQKGRDQYWCEQCGKYIWFGNKPTVSAAAAKKDEK